MVDMFRPDQPAPADDPQTILEVYGRHPHLHPYGIADVAQLWDRSRWWRAGDGVVGLMDLPGSPEPVLYAISDQPEPALGLLARLEPALPAQMMATGPPGLAERLSQTFAPDFVTPYVKMHLARPADLPDADDAVKVIAREDLPALQVLFETDPLAGDFFHPGLLDTGFYLGLWREGVLAAAGGIHVIDEANGVAAIGNVTTHPQWRRQGLSRRVVATLCRRLLAKVAVVGLNVRQDNPAALGLYRALGFQTILPYEETRLRRR